MVWYYKAEFSFLIDSVTSAVLIIFPLSNQSVRNMLSHILRLTRFHGATWTFLGNLGSLRLLCSLRLWGPRAVKDPGSFLCPSSTFGAPGLLFDPLRLLGTLWPPWFFEMWCFCSPGTFLAHWTFLEVLGLLAFMDLRNLGCLRTSVAHYLL